jgi:nucleoid DNA-binding protein
MKKPQIARRLAKRSGVTKAEAADQLDRVVHEILSDLRRGQRAALPGLGVFLPGAKWNFEFDKPKRRGR